MQNERAWKFQCRVLSGTHRTFWRSRSPRVALRLY